MMVTVRKEPSMSVSPLSIRVARSELKARGWKVRQDRFTKRFTVAAEKEAKRDLYGQKEDRFVFEPEELIVFAGYRVLCKLIKK